MISWKKPIEETTDFGAAENKILKCTTILDELQEDVNLLQSKISEFRRRIQKCSSEEDIEKIDDEIHIDEGYKHIDLF